VKRGRRERKTPVRERSPPVPDHRFDLHTFNPHAIEQTELEERSLDMTLRPIVRALIVPVLGLSLSGIAAHPAAAEGEPQKQVNINQASATELARLPRVGAKLADRIVAHRAQHGAFKRIEDLMEVKGVGEKMFAGLKPYLSVSGATTLAEKVSKSGSRGKSRGGKSKGKKAPPEGASEKG
jgi:competence protein ComEA